MIVRITRAKVGHRQAHPCPKRPDYPVGASHFPDNADTAFHLMLIQRVGARAKAGCDIIHIMRNDGDRQMRFPG